MSSQEVAREQIERLARSPLAALEFSRRNFDDPALEWRPLFSEILGTFLLVLVGAGLGVVNAVSNGAIKRTAAVTAPGLTVLVIILFMGAVSGAHFNPAVSIVFAAPAISVATRSRLHHLPVARIHTRYPAPMGDIRQGGNALRH
jgi:hypothetical protein